MEPFRDQPWKDDVKLLAILLLAALLRFWGISFGLPGTYRPDEEYLVSRAISFHTGDLNPGLFIYPTLYTYLVSGVFALVKWIGEAFGAFGPEGFHAFLRVHQNAPLYLIARCTTALLGTLSVWAVWRLGKISLGRPQGLLAAGLLAVNFSHVRDSHFGTTDVPMTFFCILALAEMVLVAKRGRRRDYALAGVFTGLALSTKYSALGLGIPFLVGHLLNLLRQRLPPWHLKETGLLVGAGVLVILCFVLTSPFTILDYQAFLRDLNYQEYFIRHGIAGVDMPTGWRWFFGFGLPYGAGLVITALFVVAVPVVLVTAIRSGPTRVAAPLILASFAVAMSLSLIASRSAFFRYIVPLMPLVALLVADLVFRAVGRAFGPRRSLAISALLLGILSLGPGQRALDASRLLATKDTRQLAREWISANIPPRSRIAVHKAFMYGKPRLPRGYAYAGIERIGNPDIQWVLVDESPLRKYSPPLPPRARRILDERGRLEVTFDAFVSPDHSQAVYDQTDAFYLPLAGFRAVRRPGPILKIYEQSPTLAGLEGRYFRSLEWSGEPALVRIDPIVDFDWKIDRPLSTMRFSVEWNGRLEIASGGGYTFRLESDEGSFLDIDGRQVIDNGGQHKLMSRAGTAELSRGSHWVRVRYFNSALSGEIRLYWTRPEHAEELVPEAVLKPPPPWSQDAMPKQVITPQYLRPEE